MCFIYELVDQMQFGYSLDSFPCFTRLNPCVAHCSTDSIPWVHHSREVGSLDYDGGFVRLQIHMNFDMIIYHQHLWKGGGKRGWRPREGEGTREEGVAIPPGSSDIQLAKLLMHNFEKILQHLLQTCCYFKLFCCNSTCTLKFETVLLHNLQSCNGGGGSLDL
jgi:hypothetical protein